MNNTDKKVFIVNKSGHDFKDARRFGEFVYLSEGKMDRYAITSVYREFSSYLNDSDESDYILLTGLTSMCSIACAIFAYKHGCLNLLLYKNNRYIERRLILSELIKDEKQKEQ
jgi:hypothetical protein